MGFEPTTYCIRRLRCRARAGRRSSSQLALGGGQRRARGGDLLAPLALLVGELGGTC
jgi:hypothetical protein